jgi:hypothetical protein
MPSMSAEVMALATASRILLPTGSPPPADSNSNGWVLQVERGATLPTHGDPPHPPRPAHQVQPARTHTHTHTHTGNRLPRCRGHRVEHRQTGALRHERVKRRVGSCSGNEDCPALRVQHDLVAQHALSTHQVESSQATPSQVTPLGTQPPHMWASRQRVSTPHRAPHRDQWPGSGP